MSEFNDVPLLGFDAEELFDKWGVALDPLEHIRSYIADALEYNEPGGWVLEEDTKADMVFFLEQLCANVARGNGDESVFEAVLCLSGGSDLEFSEYFSALLPLMVVDDGS